LGTTPFILAYHRQQEVWSFPIGDYVSLALYSVVGDQQPIPDIRTPLTKVIGDFMSKGQVLDNVNLSSAITHWFTVTSMSVDDIIENPVKAVKLCFGYIHHALKSTD